MMVSPFMVSFRHFCMHHPCSDITFIALLCWFRFTFSYSKALWEIIWLACSKHRLLKASLVCSQTRSDVFPLQFYYSANTWKILFSASVKGEDAIEIEDSKEVLKVKETETVEPAPETNGEDSGSKPEIDQDEYGSESGQSTFSYDQLKAKSDNPVTGIDFKRREVCCCVDIYLFLIIISGGH